MTLGVFWKICRVLASYWLQSYKTGSYALWHFLQNLLENLSKGALPIKKPSSENINKSLYIKWLFETGSSLQVQKNYALILQNEVGFQSLWNIIRYLWKILNHLKYLYKVSDIYNFVRACKCRGESCTLRWVLFFGQIFVLKIYVK